MKIAEDNVEKYTEKDIVVLSDRDHVRMRLPMYFGSVVPTTYEVPLFTDVFTLKQFTFIPAAYKAVGEILDNCVDEFSHITEKNKILTIEAVPEKGYYSIGDNGRGVPIGKMENGRYTPEVVFGSLRSGRNFKDDKKTGVIGQNGIGAAATAYTSTSFQIKITRDGKEYTQEFKDGVSEIVPPKIKKTTTRTTGTTISFNLDPEVYANVELPTDLLRNKAIEVAFNNPNTTVTYNGEKFHYKNGLEDVVKNISKDYFRFGIEGFEFFVIFDQYQGVDEKVFTWVNSSLLYDGGMCNTQFVNAFVDATTEHLRKDAKKLGAEVTRNDIRQNLLILGSLKVSDPVYDSQGKTRLIGPNIRKELDGLISSGWSLFARRNKEWLDAVLERANERHHKSANKKASDDFKKTLRKKVPGLLDAVDRDRMKCKLFITEGLCFDADTPIRVLREGGFEDIPSKFVEPGDLVITHKNRLRPVISKSLVVKDSLIVKTNKGVNRYSPYHRVLTYDTVTKDFSWVEIRHLDKSIHKLVHSRLSNFEYVAQINKIEKTDDPHYRFCVTYNEKETVVCSETHTFIIFDVESGSIFELVVTDINPTKHGMVMFSTL